MIEPYGIPESEAAAAHPVRYGLKGPQVEPEAGYWTFSGVRFSVVDVDDLPASTLPVFRSDPRTLEFEFFELQRLEAQRRNGPIEGEDKHPDDPQDRTRLPLSRFFRLNPPPLSAIFNIERDREVTDVFEQCDPGPAIVRNGEELARMFEDETPGLLHRHAVNCLLFQSGVSPPRQARIWAALDIAIYSALLAAWRFKWAIDRSNGAPDYHRSYVERPSEYAARNNIGDFEVLYDRQVQPDGSGSQPEPRCPVPGKPQGPQNDDLLSPGTPRHPAYPSGHSTYSAAASEVLAYFFPHERVEFERLADNIGMARLWAGVHWRQDHLAGRRLGIAVAQRVIWQLRNDPVKPIPQPLPMPCDGTIMPPEFETLRSSSQKMRNAGGVPGQDVIPPPDRSVRELQGPNRGAS